MVRFAMQQRVFPPMTKDNPLAGQHNAYRQCDEYFCPRCTKRWPVSEDAPEKCS